MRLSDSPLTFKMKNKQNKWSLGDGGNDVDLRLNRKPEWNIMMNMGAGEVNLDMADYKLRSFRFDGGAASIDLKVGSLLPVTDVTVKTGVADVKINIPEGSGCRIKTKTGLSAKDFTVYSIDLRSSNGELISVHLKITQSAVKIDKNLFRCSLVIGRLVIAVIYLDKSCKIFGR